jgi:CRP-like cAMP-binding protein
MNAIDFQTNFDIDDYIFKEGDDGDCAYIIDSGMVEISLDKDGHKLVVATLTKGDILGEMAIVNWHAKLTLVSSKQWLNIWL